MSSRHKFPCPSCGAELPFESSISLLAVCAYCGTMAQRKDLILEDLGKVAQLQPDGSPLQIHSEGCYEGTPFTVIGRLQMRYTEGYWNEWHLRFSETRTGWLGEAQGLYAVSFAVKDMPAIAAFEKLSIGSVIVLDNANYRVRGKEEAAYISAEGELPFRVTMGQTGRFADLAGPGGSFATIDYSDEAPLAFTGRYAEFAELSLTRLKEIPGW